MDLTLNNHNSSIANKHLRDKKINLQENQQDNTTNTSPISILQFNARSLLPKRSELHALSAEIKPDIIAVTETWLGADVPDGSFLPPGYNTAFRVDRTDRPGGGVIIVCRNDRKFTQRLNLCTWRECAWIELERKSQHRRLLIGCYYRPPSTSSTAVDEFILSLELTMSHVDLLSTDVLIVGDFNAKSSTWCSLDRTNVPGRMLQTAFLSLGLQQCVTSRTHLDNEGSLSSLLDLVLVSDTNLITTVDTLPPIGNSDHLPVICHLATTLSSAVKPQPQSRRIWCYAKANFSALRSALAKSDWSAVSAAKDIDSAWSSWLRIFYTTVSQHVPSKTIKKIKPKLPWITSAIEQEIKTKRALFRQYKRSPSQQSRLAFNTQRNKVTQLLRRAERAHVLQLYRTSSCTQSSSRPRFWDFVRSLSGHSQHPPIPDIHLAEDQPISTSNEKADAFNTFFAKQTHLDDSKSKLDPTSLTNNEEEFSSISTTPASVFQILSSLPRRKAPGIDGVPNYLLRECASGIASSLALLFNRSFADCRFPTDWKHALVVPVFKRGNRSLLTNYRPISLLSTVSKVCERVIYDKLYRFLSPVLSHQQSGFRKQDGTAQQLLRLVQQWSEALDESKYVGVIFFDLRKAFDRVWHKGLLAKLQAAGIRGAALAWFKSYLCDRHQCTRVEDAISPSSSLNAGVPQGAILSPLLFLVYINDITQASPANINLFADDTSTYVVDSCAERLSARLQQTVDSLSTWYDRWLLSTNAEKSVVLVLRSPRMEPVEVSLSLNTTIIPQANTHKHLGVTFNDSLSWESHVDELISRASKRIGLLRRYRRHLAPLAIRHIYIVSIRPALEYASVAWSGLSATAAERLERVQRKAARLITGDFSRETTHELLLARAGLPSLSSRRKIELAVFAYKFLRRLTPEHLSVGLDHWTTTKPERAASLRNVNAIRLPRPKKSILKHSPLYLSMSLWNSLPPQATSASSSHSLRSIMSSLV